MTVTMKRIVARCRLRRRGRGRGGGIDDRCWRISFSSMVERRLGRLGLVVVELLYERMLGDPVALE